MEGSQQQQQQQCKPLVLFYATEKEDPFKGMPQFAADILEAYFELVSVARYEQHPALKASVEGVITAGGVVQRALAPIIDTLPNLKIITTLGAGYNHLEDSLELYRKRDIKVGNIPLAVTTATADFTFALLMASARDIVSAREEAMSPERNQGFYDYKCMGTRVWGATIGIIGMGRIGFQVAQRAMGFNMTVLYNSRNRRLATEEEAVKATYFSDLKEMVPLCDYLVVCCPLTSQTRHMITKDVLFLMKPTSTIVNTSRGGVIDSNALVEVLEAGRIRGAALDVTEPEPLPDAHPLLRMRNVLITSHKGSCDREGRHYMWEETRDNLKNVLVDGGDLLSQNKIC